MQNYDFPVQLEPIYFGEDKYQIAGKKAVVRTDTQEALGVVSNDYGLLKHGTVIDTFREATASFGVEEKITLTNNGGNLFYELLFPKVEGEVQKGDIVRLRMIVKNSYNGSNSLQIVFGGLRLVCLNGMVVGTKFFGFQFRHTKNITALAEMALDAGKIKTSLEQYVGLFGKSVDTMAGMAQKPLQVTDGLFSKDEVRLPQYLLDEARVEYERAEDASVWGYYNALTYAITHKTKKPNPQLAIWHGAEAWKTAERLAI